MKPSEELQKMNAKLLVVLGFIDIHTNDYGQFFARHEDLEMGLRTRVPDYLLDNGAALSLVPAYHLIVDCSSDIGVSVKWGSWNSDGLTHPIASSESYFNHANDAAAVQYAIVCAVLSQQNGWGPDED